MSSAFAMISPPTEPRLTRVMIVDDSAVIRGLVSRWLLEHADLTVVATAPNGRAALDMLDAADPDIVVLDLDMPELDGLTALPLMLRRKPGLSVLVASALTRRNAEISLRCLSLGATDYIPKPENNRGITTSLNFRRELVLKIDALAMARRRRERYAATQAALSAHAVPAAADISARPAGAADEAVLPRTAVMPRCLLIGASTGGPRAISTVLGELGPSVLEHLPVLIVQHMPPIFTAVFAEHLRMQTGRPAREPEDGERIVPGVVYIAPGGRHLGVMRFNGHPAVRLDDGPPINFCRPAVDLLFREAAAVYGPAALAVMLTGMGSDGLQGARALADAGATIIAQDEATSTVWGMPGAVARAGLATAVLPLPRISEAVRALVRGGSR
ncbi:chemotaxis response regulator protein-glutamate methylesterase [Chelatococcus sp. SYSU_G07232]|uniref:Protein-glutamate methylesterase/protein-glutamine glutaminase n=1 Tax=Chelatococcus albus TaxID=3047466 RepID=A0ABT7AFM7_9HYPH|nr:chemotaxis response regulator protein-glutamate methylesterase [Chelatococcus sp. SYSU_G07232]MDJ1158138.1 chemotaxis response regulator protein-glutamate methylesterase [Chelatococcus sp. SYSU_G07232]